MSFAAAIRPGLSHDGGPDPADPAAIWRASSRLDLHTLWVSPPADPEWRLHPMFSHPVLNRAVILKFNMSAQDANRGSPRRLGATKLMLPLLEGRIGSVSKSVIIAPVITEQALLADLDYRAYDLGRDLRLLDRLAWLPTLDPYMVGEMGRHFELHFSPRYLQISRQERLAAAATVMAAIAPRLEWLLEPSRRAATGPSRLMVQLLGHAACPERTREIARRVGMDRMRWSISLLAWKGLVYYGVRLQLMEPHLRRIADEIGGAAPIQAASREDLAMIDLSRGRVLRAMTLARREAGELADAFGEAMDVLGSQRQVRLLTAFLQVAPGCMSALGERVRRLDEVCGVWRANFPDGFAPTDTERLRSLLAALERQLATDLVLTPCRPTMPGPRG
jgi:hypothetical protein